MVTFLGSLVQSCCEEGGTRQTSITGCVGSARSVSAPPVCPHSQRGYFHGLHCSGSRLLCWELSEVGPGLSALPRSKSLRSRYLSTPQRCRLGWACILCPSLVQVAQVFGEHGHCNLLPLPSLLLSFLGVQPAHLLRQMLTVQNPKKSWLAMKPACS